MSLYGKLGKTTGSQEESKEKEKLSREILGKYFYDLSKLSFAAMVLGVVVPWFSEKSNFDYLILLVIGLLTTAFLGFFGYKIIKNKLWKA